MSGKRADIVGLSADIVAAYVSNNRIPTAELPALISLTHAAIQKLGSQIEAAAAPPEKLVPAVPIRKSITAHHLVCLEDGKKFKTLKRHLRTSYNLSPEQYREKWGLPPDYPMVAPDYAEARSQMAKKTGLGQLRGRGSRKSD